jgi:hypothetical protein
MAEGYFINATDLSTLMDIQRVDASGHAPSMRQNDYLVPGRTGAIATKPWFGPSTVMIGGTIHANTRPLYLQKVHDLIKLCVNSGLPFTMKRVLPFPAGERTATAQARYVGGLDLIQQVSPRSGRAMAEFTLLSGFFSDETYASSQSQAGSFALKVETDMATNELIIVLSGGGNQRLTNSDTGDFVQFNASTTTHAATLNVNNFTAVQNSLNVIDKVSTNPNNTTRYYMTLVPGPNRFVLTGGGAVQIQYKGLYI